MAQPTPSTWTLRLKSHRTTVLLHIDPLATFSTIKQDLYAVLTETGLQATEHGPSLALPASPAAIQLGRPLDPLDPSAGFALGEWETQPDDDEVAIEDDGGKGKGKAAKKAGQGRECAKGAGLKDGAVLAFRWDGMPGAEGDEWKVQIASFEDAYGVTNEGDVGGRAEFEG